MEQRTTASDREAVPAEGAGDDRIRVLWLIKGLGRGGAEILLLHAAKLRDRASFDCSVGYLLGSRSWLADELRAEDVPVHLFASEHHLDLRWAVKLRRFLMSSPVDIVHTHSPFVAAAARLLVRTIPKAVRPRTISTEHLPWSGHARATRMVNGATFGLDDLHLAVSSAVVGSIPRPLRRNVRVLVHGIPVAQVRAEAPLRDRMRAELGVSPDEVLVATVANNTAQKGYADLFAAARRLVDSGRPVRFVIAGRATDDDVLRALRDRMGLTDRMNLLGPVDNAPRVMVAADLFALASHWEGLPLVILEAMALGLPVVATRVGGIPEMVRDGVDGMLVDPEQPEKLADAMALLVDDAAMRSRMGKVGAEDAWRFDNRAAVRKIEDAYREVVARRGRVKRRT